VKKPPCKLDYGLLLLSHTYFYAVILCSSRLSRIRRLWFGVRVPMSGDGAQATLSKSLCRICRTSFGEFLVGGELLFQGTADRSVIGVAVHGDFLFRKILEDRSNMHASAHRHQPVSTDPCLI
jgi:hypothetical protein